MGDILETSQLGLDEIQQELTAHDELILDDDADQTIEDLIEWHVVFREGSD